MRKPLDGVHTQSGEHSESQARYNETVKRKPHLVLKERRVEIRASVVWFTTSRHQVCLSGGTAYAPSLNLGARKGMWVRPPRQAQCLCSSVGRALP